MTDIEKWNKECQFRFEGSTWFSIREHEFTLDVEDIHPPRGDKKEILKLRLKRLKAQRKEYRKKYKERQRDIDARRNHASVEKYHAFYDNPSWNAENKGSVSKKARRSKNGY